MELGTPGLDPSAFVAPGAHVFGDVRVGPRVVILFGVVARAELDRIVIGAETNIQDNAVLHCDTGFPCTIGRRVTVGHAAVVHGATVGDHCLVGIGSRVLNGAVMGEGSWLAAGSLLPEGKTLPPWTLGIGTPARPLRDLTEAERIYQSDGVEDYLRIGELYRAAFAG